MGATAIMIYTIIFCTHYDNKRGRCVDSDTYRTRKVRGPVLLRTVRAHRTTRPSEMDGYNFTYDARREFSPDLPLEPFCTSSAQGRCLE